MNRHKYPVVKIWPTHAEVVAEHVLLVDAQHDAAMRDVDAEPGVWHVADEPGTDCDHARAH